MARNVTTEAYAVVSLTPKSAPTHARWTVYFSQDGRPCERQGKISVSRVRKESRLSPSRALRETERLAHEAAESVRREIVEEASRPKTVVTEKAWTVQAWCDHCVDRIIAKERDLRYAKQIKAQLLLHVYEQVGEIPLSELTVERLEDWWAWLETTPRSAPIYNAACEVVGRKQERILGWKSRDLVRGYLSSCLGRAVERGHLRFNPVLALPDDRRAREAYKAERKTRLRWFSAEELATLLEGAKGSPVYAPLLIQMDLAVRAGEACGLGIEDVDLDTGKVNVVRQLARKPESAGGPTVLAPCAPKGMSRPFRASDELIALVRLRRQENAALPPLQRCPYVAQLGGRPMDPNHFCKLFRILCATAEVPLPKGNSTHAIRRSVLNILKEAPGLSSATRSLIAGHESERTTELYLEDVMTAVQREELAQSSRWLHSTIRAA